MFQFWFWLSFALLWQIYVCVNQWLEAENRKIHIFMFQLELLEQTAMGSDGLFILESAHEISKSVPACALKLDFSDEWFVTSLGVKRGFGWCYEVLYGIVQPLAPEREAVQIWVSCSCTNQGTAPWLQRAVGTQLLQTCGMCIGQGQWSRGGVLLPSVESAPKRSQDLCWVYTWFIYVKNLRFNIFRMSSLSLWEIFDPQTSISILGM